jgi:hypothetical protein
MWQGASAPVGARSWQGIRTVEKVSSSCTHVHFYRVSLGHE